MEILLNLHDLLFQRFVILQSSRPSTPIGEVLEFKYQEDWIEQQRRIQDAKTQKTLAKVGPVFLTVYEAAARRRKTRSIAEVV
jgi:hypothetical protein